MSAGEREAKLAEYLRASSGAESVRVRNLAAMAGGASRELWSLDVDLIRGGETRTVALVLRADPPGGEIQSLRREEFEILRVAREAGVLVPEPFGCCEDPSVMGSPFLLMERVPGETLARRLLRDPRYAATRRALTGDLARALAGIHALDAARLPFLSGPPDGKSAAETEIDRYRDTYDAIAPNPHPAIELALRWLTTHVPPPSPLRVVHGDFRVGNVMFDERGLRAVLDWELYHLGDPIEDLGWLCVRAWRFGADDKPVGGVGERAELFAAYERAGGAAVDPAHAFFWELFGNAKWAIICIMQAKRHLDGSVRSVELASLGRRAAETEIELLELLERA